MDKRFRILVALFVISAFSALQAQKKDIKSRFSVKLGGGVVTSEANSYMYLHPIFVAEASYNVNKFLDIGLYAGYSSFEHHYTLPYNQATGMYEWYSADSTSYTRSSSPGFSQNSKAYFYGVSSYIHLLPLIFKSNLRFDVYAAPRIGLAREQYYELAAQEELVWSEPFLEYGLGLGLKYGFTRHVGIYGEYSLGRYFNNNKSRMLDGIVFTL